MGEIVAEARRRRRRRHATATGAVAVLLIVAGVALGGLLGRSPNSATVADGIAGDVTDGVAEEPIDPSGNTTAPPSTVDPSGERTATTGSGAPTETVPSAVTAPTSEPSSTPTGGSTDAPTDPVTTPTGSTDGPVRPPESEPAEAATTAGLRTSSERTSEWFDGYCFQMEVVNEGGPLESWQVVLDLGGAVDTFWNITAESSGERTVFTGIPGYNARLDAGDTASFGACVDVTPEP